MPIEINEENFKSEVYESDKLTIVDFWAPWCGPCRMLSPILDEIDAFYKGKIKICKVNTDQCQKLAVEFSVSTIPTVLFFKNGKQCDRFVGLSTQDDIKARIDSFL
ncbi:MAG: thioredoxin [Elusimicrobiota bacterium]|jgi:thioredoxin 1|nr:thioredoxin [Elusimicrobiota bacterium]